MPVSEDVLKMKTGELPAELFADMYESGPDAIVVVDNHSVICSVNRKAELMFGYDRSELIGQGIEILVPEAQRVKHVALRNRFMINLRQRSMGLGMTLMARHSTGVEFRVEVELSPTPTPKGIFVSARVMQKGEARNGTNNGPVESNP